MFVNSFLCSFLTNQFYSILWKYFKTFAFWINVRNIHFRYLCFIIVTFKVNTVIFKIRKNSIPDPVQCKYTVHCTVYLIKLCKNYRSKKEYFFVPRTCSVVTIKSRKIFNRKSLVLYGFLLIDLPAAHSSIHALFILRSGLTNYQLPKGFWGLRIIECRNSPDILEWGPDAIQTHSSQSFVIPDWIPPGTYS